MRRHGATLEPKDATGRTPLHLGVESGDAEVLLVLLRGGADVRAEASDPRLRAVRAVLDWKLVRTKGRCSHCAQHIYQPAVESDRPTKAPPRSTMP